MPQVCGGLALGLLHPQELELLAAGLPHLDFAALEAGAKVRGRLSKGQAAHAGLPLAAAALSLPPCRPAV